MMMLTMRKIRGGELKRFKKLEGEYHYMGETRSAGDTLRLVAEEDGAVVGFAYASPFRTRAAYRYLIESIRQFPGVDTMTAELRSAGFSTVTVKRLSFGIAALHIARKS